MPETESKSDELVQTSGVPDQIALVREAAESLKKRAANLSDPEERKRILQEAYDREIEKHGNTKFARRLQSGAWQGAAGGIGIGGGVGIGVGAAVGTLVGGVVSIPTTALGGIIGTGVGAIHGPWIKFNTKKGKAEGANLTPEQTRAAQNAADVQERRSRQDRAEIHGGIEDAQREAAVDEVVKERRKPRKLDNRSQKALQQSLNGDQSLVESNGVVAEARKKPRKLQMRSASDVK